MKSWKTNLMLAALFLGSAVAIAQSWFPEGSAPRVGDGEGRSLQKINYDIHNQSTNGVKISQMAFTATGTNGQVTTATITLSALAGQSGSFVVHKAIIASSSSNTVDTILYTGANWTDALQAGNGYLFDPGSGGSIDLNAFSVAAKSTSTNAISIWYLR